MYYLDSFLQIAYLMYKISKYTRDFVINDVHIIYNMVSDSIIIIAHDIFNIILQHKDNLDEIKTIHPELFDSLIQSKNIVPATISDETTELIQSWIYEDENPKEIKITIIPTVQCNLRCWYCYEDHSTKAVITEKTIDSIKRFIENIAKQASIKKIIIDFFGGEPLLCFENCIKPIVLHAEKVCNRHNKSLGIAFTTNGVLLTSDKCDFLSSINATVSFQITLDGDENSHNAVRFLPGGSGTYNIIINNIMYALSNKLHVSIRFNYTQTNHSSYELTINDLLRKFRNIANKHLIDFSFHKVWQEQTTPEIESSISLHREWVGEKGYNYNIPIKFGSSSRCYADNPNDVVINHNGKIYKCTARDFTQERAEGTLQDNGNIQWNNRSLSRLSLMYGTSFCQRCRIFPICRGGCSQNRLEYHSEPTSCYYNHTEEYKETLVRNRVIELLKQHISTN